jgi:hypothetical protein
VRRDDEFDNLHAEIDNRWNDTMATGLEHRPAAVAQRTLAGFSWEAGKHAAEK